MPQERFVEFIGRAILSLPQDMKTMLRVFEDPDIDDEGRILAAGSLLHVLSGSNSIPGLRGVLAYIDDALVLRVVLSSLQKRHPEALSRHREQAPELLESLEEDLALARDSMGDGFRLLEKAAEEAHRLTHQGRNATQCARDADTGTWLYDMIHGAIVERLEFDEDEVHRETKRVDSLLEQLRGRTSSIKS